MPTLRLTVVETIILIVAILSLGIVAPSSNVIEIRRDKMHMPVGSQTAFYELTEALNQTTAEEFLIDQLLIGRQAGPSFRSAECLMMNELF